MLNKIQLHIDSLADNVAPVDGKRRFPGWPYYEEDEVEVVTCILRSGLVNYWTGQEGRRFEEEFAAMAGAEHAVAMMNGSVALEAALMALGVKRGDEVIVSSRTFIASAGCIVMRGARPVMADVDPVSQNITAETISKALTPGTKGIIAVHLAGWPCDMDPIMDLARENGLWVVEDCAQATGALYKGRPVGSIGAAGTFSFCQDKIISTGGEGGMLVTNNHDIWDRVWAFKDHGKSFDAVYCREHLPGFRWFHESFGTNWRMTEMQGAIGRLQLRKLSEWVLRRRENADLLTERFSRFDALRVTEPGPEIYHSYYKYYTFVKPERLKPGWHRDRIIREINDLGIPCFTGSCSEIYLEKAFIEGGLQPKERLPVSRELGDTSLMFLVHPTLSVNDMVTVADAMETIMPKATR